MVAKDELEAQIAEEAAAIAAAPRVDTLPPMGRCAWCGRLSHDLTLVERHGEFERYKCHLCVGAIYE